jgi:branched-chain amino acid transport system substrate-binding protein
MNPGMLDRIGEGRRSALVSGSRVLLGLSVLGVVACQPRTPFRIGFLGGLSGRVSDLAIDGRNGALLAIETANLAGGIAGRKLELVVRDDEQKADVAKRVMGELADAHVEFVVGPMTSMVAVAVAPVADARQVVLLSPTATTHELSGKVDHFFRVVADAPSGAVQEADQLIRSGVRSLVTVGDASNRAFSDSWADAVAKRFTERGGRVLAQLHFQSGADARLSELAGRLVSAKADVIVIVAGAVDTALIAAQLRLLNAQVLLAVAPWAGTEQLIQLGGKAIDGALVPQYFDRNSTSSAYLAFVEHYTNRFGERPGFSATNAYDSVNVGLAALSQRQPGQSLKDALLARTEYPGVQRPIRMDAYGDGAGLLYLTQVRDGRFVPLSQ